jgi:hypothetical protein
MRETIALQLHVWSFFVTRSRRGRLGSASLWAQMGTLAKIVVIGLFIMSAWSIAS